MVMTLPLFGLTGNQQWGGLPQQQQQQGQTNQTSFQPNMYTNPQMGAMGGGSPANYAGAPTQGTYQQSPVTGQTPQGYVNTQSPMTAWQMAQAPTEAMWVGQTPDHMGQSYSYNPLTGQGDWVNAAGGLQVGGTNPYGQGAISWIDPITGMQSIDPGALMDAFGFNAGGGSATPYDPYQMTGFSPGQITPPDPYGGGDWSRPEELSAREVIESYRPTMEAEIGEGFAEAGNRLGQSGFGMSTSYAKALGDVERLARAQMNQRTLEYGYDATKFDRSQELARQMAENQEKYGGWQTHGGWQMGAQGQNVANEMQKWMLENQLGFQGHHAGQMFNLESQMMDKQMQQQMLASLLGGMF
jgi:hypothetical protein